VTRQREYVLVAAAVGLFCGLLSASFDRPWSTGSGYDVVLLGTAIGAILGILWRNS
jgi:ElaB/YqjD/DUF883 family membrane-anchored ribosome-binding protein